MRLAVAVAAALVLGAAPASAAVQLVKVGDFSAPIYVASPPGDWQRVFVVERAGRIQVLDNGVKHQFLDISSTVRTDGERGLLSMAFAPDYATSGLFYVFDVDKATTDVKIEEFRRSATDPDAADPTTRRVVLDRPHSASNHNGGQLQFGPDGYLYATIGDNANGQNARDVTNVYGKLLRIDPRAGHALAPADNPFAGQSVDAPLVWSYGLRNPWRFSFDSATGDLVIADVGESTQEEVDWAPASQGRGRGLDFGWWCREGLIAGPGGCSAPGATDPVLIYTHSNGCAIVGGFVVHADDLPSLAGRYVYGDNCGGWIRSAVLKQPQVTDDRSESPTVSGLYSFGTDSCGHIYATSGSGPVYRLSEQAVPPQCSPPTAPQPGPSPGSGSTTPTASPTPPDTTAPRLFLSFRKRQRAARTGRVVIGVRCDEPCQVTASGSLGRLGRLTPARGAATAGATRKLTLHIGRPALARLRRALRRHAVVVAHVRVSAVDAAHNATAPKILAIRLAR